MGFDPISYILGAKSGGGGVTVEPLSVSVNGTVTAPQGKAYSPVIANVPSPNFKETIQGTLANPLGNSGYSVAELVDLYSTDAITLRMFCDATAIGFGSFSANVYAVNSSGNELQMKAIQTSGSTVSDWAAVDYKYYAGGGTYAYALTGGNSVDMNAYVAYVPTVLTIIHHPLPEDNT